MGLLGFFLSVSCYALLDSEILSPFQAMIYFFSRTTRRPVPLEHCLFFSGELYRICENEKFIELGLKAAKDVHKKKTSLSGSVGSNTGQSSARSGPQGEKRENFNRGKPNKHSSSHGMGSFLSDGSSKSNWGFRRSEVSLWLQLINKLSQKSLLPVCFRSLISCYVQL